MSQFIQKNENNIVQEGIQKAAIVTKKLKISSKCERSDSLYETVIQKNFQTINELLRKLNTIISKHEEFEYEMMNYTKRLSKIEADMESIHNQHRRDNLHIFSNIEDLKYELNGIDNHIKMIYDNYKKKGFSTLAKSRQNSARVLQGSQRCQSQEEITEQPILSKCLLENIGASVKTSHSNLKKNQKNQKVDSQILKAQIQDVKNILDHNKSHFKQNENMSASSKLIAQTNLKRKITIQKKQQLRQSLQEKCKNINNRLGHQQRELRKQNQFRSENNNRQITSDENITPKQSQVSWNLQRFLSAISNSNEQKSQKQKAQMIRKSILSHQKNDSKVVLNYISQNFANIKQSGHNNTITTSQLQQCIKICLNDEKFRDIEKRIGQIFLKNLQTEKDINDLSRKIKQINQKSNLYVTIPKLSEDFYIISKDLNKLRTYCHQNFAHKGETKKAFLFIENKIKNIQFVAQNSNNQSQVSLIVSKCLGCNRVSNFGHETTLKVPYWTNSFSEQNQQKKIGIKQLKKKTFQVVKNERKRPFCKYERANGI